jgi:hypothetical protein
MQGSVVFEPMLTSLVVVVVWWCRRRCARPQAGAVDEAHDAPYNRATTPPSSHVVFSFRAYASGIARLGAAGHGHAVAF